MGRIAAAAFPVEGVVTGDQIRRLAVSETGFAVRRGFAGSRAYGAAVALWCNCTVRECGRINQVGVPVKRRDRQAVRIYLHHLTLRDGAVLGTRFVLFRRVCSQVSMYKVPQRSSDLTGQTQPTISDNLYASMPLNPKYAVIAETVAVSSATV